jgi:hypothetical protein
MVPAGSELGLHRSLSRGAEGRPVNRPHRDPPAANPTKPAVVGPAQPTYSGMLPCLRRGPGWRLVSSVRSAVITFGRVSCGMITSSR